MEELAANDSLTEETRASAKKALDELASAQVLATENKALRKTQSAALEKLELEVEFETQKARSALGEEMAEWLGQNRLQHYRKAIIQVH